jgi:hypothetical protein
MANANVSGSTGGVFDWSCNYDDAARTATLEATGQGRCTVVLEQSNGPRASVQFRQPGGDVLPVPDSIIPQPVANQIVDIGTGPLVITNIRLKPNPSPKPGGVGGFVVVTENWQP